MNRLGLIERHGVFHQALHGREPGAKRDEHNRPLRRCVQHKVAARSAYRNARAGLELFENVVGKMMAV